MKKLLVLLALFVGTLIPHAASAQFNGCMPGFCGAKSAGGATYIGPGDVTPATIWWGLQAYSAAKRGTRSINLCDDTGSNCSDVLTDSTSGKLNNPGTHGTNNCATSTTCQIAAFYDQTGNLACGGTACDALPDNSNRATLTFSCINGGPCAVNTNAGYAAASSVTSISQPYALAIVANRTGAFTTEADVIQANSTFGEIFYANSANSVNVFSGTVPGGVSGVTDSNFHVLIGQINGASSTIFCQGSAGASCSTSGVNNALSGTAGTAAFTGTLGFISAGGTGNQLVGQITSGGVYTGNISSTQSALASNQYSFWGPF